MYPKYLEEFKQYWQKWYDLERIYHSPHIYFAPQIAAFCNELAKLAKEHKVKIKPTELRQIQENYGYIWPELYNSFTPEFKGIYDTLHQKHGDIIAIERAKLKEQLVNAQIDLWNNRIPTSNIIGGDLIPVLCIKVPQYSEYERKKFDKQLAKIDNLINAVKIYPNIQYEKVVRIGLEKAGRRDNIHYHYLLLNVYDANLFWATRPIDSYWEIISDFPVPNECPAIYPDYVDLEEFVHYVHTK